MYSLWLLSSVTSVAVAFFINLLFRRQKLNRRKHTCVEHHAVTLHSKLSDDLFSYSLLAGYTLGHDTKLLCRFYFQYFIIDLCVITSSRGFEARTASNTLRMYRLKFHIICSLFDCACVGMHLWCGIIFFCCLIIIITVSCRCPWQTVTYHFQS